MSIENPEINSEQPISEEEKPKMEYLGVHERLENKANYFTEDEVAKMLGLAPRTISKWVEKKELIGYRSPADGKFHVKRDNLVKFLKEKGDDKSMAVLELMGEEL